MFLPETLISCDPLDGNTVQSPYNKIAPLPSRDGKSSLDLEVVVMPCFELYYSGRAELAIELLVVACCF